MPEKKKIPVPVKPYSNVCIPCALFLMEKKAMNASIEVGYYVLI